MRLDAIQDQLCKITPSIIIVIIIVIIIINV